MRRDNTGAHKVLSTGQAIMPTMPRNRKRSRLPPLPLSQTWPTCLPSWVMGRMTGSGSAQCATICSSRAAAHRWDGASWPASCRCCRDPRVRCFFVGGDQHQRLACGGAVFKHHGGLDGITDGARDQVQVVVGIGAQCKQRHQRQKMPAVPTAISASPRCTRCSTRPSVGRALPERFYATAS